MDDAQKAAYVMAQTACMMLCLDCLGLATPIAHTATVWLMETDTLALRL